MMSMTALLALVAPPIEWANVPVSKLKKNNKLLFTNDRYQLLLWV